MNEGALLWRTGRVWQGQTAYIVIELLGSRSHTLKKSYLYADANTGSFKIEVSKPENLKPTSAFSEIVKKHLKQGILLGKSQTDSLKSLVIHRSSEKSSERNLESSSEDYAYFCFEMDVVPVLHFVSLGLSLVRLSTKGTFTKTQPFTQPISLECSPLELESRKDTGRDNEKNPENLPSQEMGSEFKVAISRLKRKARTLHKSIVKGETKVSSSEAIDLQKLKINLLSMHLGSLESSRSEILLLADDEGKPVEIELDPELTPGKNLDAHYKKLKKMQKSLEIGNQFLTKAKNEYLALMEFIAMLSQKNQDSIGKESPALDSLSLESIYKRFEIPWEAQKQRLPSQDTETKPYREFKGKNGVVFLVGKSAIENDLLCKQAKGNDLWFHVVSGTGSHVIVPAKSLKQKVAEPWVIRQAGILAIHFSKLRASRSAEVHFAARSSIKKPKGAPPGLWLVGRAESIFIRYEIEELAEALGNKDLSD
jgi:predicted ribosome quality control (RQC) complex YloA/Tae2 family protein